MDDLGGQCPVFQDYFRASEGPQLRAWYDQETTPEEREEENHMHADPGSPYTYLSRVERTVGANIESVHAVQFLTPPPTHHTTTNKG